MIEWELMEKYMDLYPDDTCCYDEPSDNAVIIHEGKAYRQPESETNETFKDRLERCEKSGENLFIREWELAKYKDNVDY